MLFLKDLVVRDRAKLWVFDFVLGADGFAEIVLGGWRIFRSADDMRIEIDKAADGLAQGFVIVQQELELLLVERSKVFLVVFKERAHVVGRDQSIPVELAPVPVVGDTDVFCQALDIVWFDDRNGERERTVRRSDDATVAVGLL